MSVEKSAGAVVFRRSKNKIEYLLLHYGAGRHWDFPKGHVEKGETEKETVLRETKEETGITDLEFAPGFRKEIKYFYKRDGKTVLKKAVFYLAETKAKKVKISFEHTGYKWLPYESAMQQLTFKNAKQILEAANNSLK